MLVEVAATAVPERPASTTQPAPGPPRLRLRAAARRFPAVQWSFITPRLPALQISRSILASRQAPGPTANSLFGIPAQQRAPPLTLTAAARTMLQAGPLRSGNQPPLA